MTLLLLWAVLLVGAARGANDIEAAQLAELDRVRAEVAGQVQLAAYDLVDELVLGWVSDPVFAKPTPVVLAGVTVPVGLGTGLQALVENHVAEVLNANPSAHIQLSHCPACATVVVHSGPADTVISRGLDDPQVLARIADVSDRTALFIDIEAEGAWLVLRARLTRLTPDLPIIWSHTIASSASTPPLLRQPTALKSAAQARQEYLDALHERGPIAIPLRFVVRSYAAPSENTGAAPPPFLWLQTGVELGSTDAKAWTSSLVLGYSFIPQAYQGVMAQARVSRLLTGKTRALTRPDLYFYTGLSVLSVWGTATASFRDEQPNLDDLLRAVAGDDPRATFGAIQVGLDLRLGNRISLSGFLETVPSLRNSPNMGAYLDAGMVGFQTLGTEVGFCF